VSKINGRTVSSRPIVSGLKTSRRKKSVVPLIGVLTLLFCTALPAQEVTSESMTWREAWSQLDEAISLYDEEKFEEAGSLFRKLREEAPAGEFDVDVLRLLEGTSFWKAEKPEEARKSLEGYEELEQIRFRMQKRVIEGDANFSLGESTYNEATKDPSKIKPAKKYAESAKGAFESALKIDPGDDYSLTKLEKTLNLIKKIEELEEEQENQDQENEDQEDSEEQDQSQEQQQDQDQQSEEDQQEQVSQDQQDQNQEDQQQQDAQDQEKGEDEEQDSQQDSQSDQQSDPSDMTQGEDSNQEPTEDYSEEQAQQLLDTYDEQERRQRRQFLQRQSRSIPVEKDW